MILSPRSHLLKVFALDGDLKKPILEIDLFERKERRLYDVRRTPEGIVALRVVIGAATLFRISEAAEVTDKHYILHEYIEPAYVLPDSWLYGGDTLLVSYVGSVAWFRVSTGQLIGRLALPGPYLCAHPHVRPT